MASEVKYVAAIDQGTSSSRFMLFSKEGLQVASHQIEYAIDTPHPGWAEVNPKLLLDTVKGCIDAVMENYSASDIVSVGITNQRETAIAWDKSSGEPLCPAIIWLDTRNCETVEKVIAECEGNADYFRASCGLPIVTYFSALKWKWMIDNVPEVQTALAQENICFGTVDTWLIYNLTGEYVTDVTNASRTMLMNLYTRDWDPKTCEFFGINEALMPTIKSSAEVYGTIQSGCLEGVPLAGAIGDQQAATLGQLCTETGNVKNTYGTGCFMLMNTGSNCVASENGLLSTALYQLGAEEECCYALEGSVAIGGQGVKWLRDNLGLFDTASEIERLAGEVEDNGGVVFVPAFSGLFAPYWNSKVRGGVLGLSLYSTKNHVCRAYLESVCFQSQDVFEAMLKDASALNVSLTRLQVDGGMTKNNLLMQLQANISQTNIYVPKMAETTVLGAAIAAGLGVNFWESLDEVCELIRANHEFTIYEPEISAGRTAELLKQWKQGITACEAFAD